MSQLTASYILSVAESTAPGQSTTGLSLPAAAHGHRFGNRGRPARAWSADRVGGHLSDDVLSFRMNKRCGLAVSPGSWALTKDERRILSWSADKTPGRSGGGRCRRRLEEYAGRGRNPHHADEGGEARAERPGPRPDPTRGR